MLRAVAHVLGGAVRWGVLRMRLGIGEKTVVLFLTNDNLRLDYYAMVYLKDLMERKYADRAVVFLDDVLCRSLPGGASFLRTLGRMVKTREQVTLCRYPASETKRVYGYYGFHKFSDRVVFTSTDRPKDNLLGRALRETKVNEEDAVCLGLYHLRQVPSPREDRKRGRTDV